MGQRRLKNIPGPLAWMGLGLGLSPLVSDRLRGAGLGGSRSPLLPGALPEAKRALPGTQRLPLHTGRRSRWVISSRPRPTPFIPPLCFHLWLLC